jgi:serine phosphatase RsbU (regulator of sigma subunit)
VPIFVREKLFGHLIVANPTEHFFDEDDLNLLSSFVETLSIAVENYFLIKDTIEKEKYRKELLIARDIQLSFLPKEFPKTDRIEISSFIHPSEEVGGDFYDFIELSEDKLFVIIGDVSGKGLGAAFYMALLKGIFFTLSKNIKTAKDFLIQLNSSLFRKIDRQIHITITALLFDFKNEQVEVVRAGHLPTFVKSGNDTLVVKTNGIGISLAKTSYFAEKLESLSLNISDAEYFVLFTDGLVEIIGDKDINKGIEKLKQIVENEVFSNPKELVEKVIENVRRNGTNFDDDATLLVLKVKNVSSTKIERYDREVINQ